MINPEDTAEAARECSEILAVRIDFIERSVPPELQPLTGASIVALSGRKSNEYIVSRYDPNRHVLGADVRDSEVVDLSEVRDFVVYPMCHF